MMELTPVAWLQARMMHASTNGRMYLRWSNDSEFFPAEFAEDFSAAAMSSISCNSILACSSERERSSARKAASFFPRRNSQRGDSETRKPPMTNKIPGGSDTQKMLRQAVSLNANSLSASPSRSEEHTSELQSLRHLV